MTVAQTAAEDVPATEVGQESTTDEESADRAGSAESEGIGESVGAEDEGFTLDSIFHALQNQRRRHVLQYLEGVDSPVEMRDIAEQVAAWEEDTTVEELTSTQRHRVYIALYQTHLPKLDELGVIEYNQSRGIVERTPLADQLKTYMDPTESADEERTEIQTTENPWDVYYLAASGLGACLLAAATFDLSVFAAVSEVAAGAVVLVVFTLLTIGQLFERYTFGDQA